MEYTISTTYQMLISGERGTTILFLMEGTHRTNAYDCSIAVNSLKRTVPLHHETGIQVYKLKKAFNHEGNIKNFILSFIPQ